MCWNLLFFFFNDTATTEIYTLSLHDALPIFRHLLAQQPGRAEDEHQHQQAEDDHQCPLLVEAGQRREDRPRSEEHTSELQSRQYLVCRLLLEKKKRKLYAVATAKKQFVKRVT